MIEVENWVILGYCFRPHGLRGGVHLQGAEHRESLFSTLPRGVLEKIPFYMIPCDKNKKLTGKAFGPHFLHDLKKGKDYRVTFKDLESVEALAKYLPFAVAIERSALPPVALDEYYLHDFIGHSVHDFKTKQVIAHIHHFEDYGAQIIFALHDLEGKFLLDLPFVPAFFPCVKCDEAGRVVYIEASLPGDD